MESGADDPIVGERLSALRKFNPEQWASVVVAELKAKHGEVRSAAESLKVSERTLHRWVRESIVRTKLIEQRVEVKFIEQAIGEGHTSTK